MSISIWKICRINEPGQICQWGWESPWEVTNGIWKLPFHCRSYNERQSKTCRSNYSPRQYSGRRSIGRVFDLFYHPHDREGFLALYTPFQVPLRRQAELLSDQGIQWGMGFDFRQQPWVFHPEHYSPLQLKLLQMKFFLCLRGVNLVERNLCSWEFFLADELILHS